MDELLKPCLVTQAQLESEVFRQWMPKMREGFQLHRKLWEYCYIAQVLYERDMLRSGRRGLGFAVGKEPLPALFASYGVEVVATDLDFEEASKTGYWTDTGQHAASLTDLNERGICEPDEFQKLVSFRPVDMNRIPADLQGFDFVWSSCAFEHLGSIKLGKKFIYNMIKVLKPGGIAVHTTEFNVFSNDATIDNTPAIIFRRRDFEEMRKKLLKQGHKMEPIDYNPGDTEVDAFVDVEPYVGRYHLKLELGGFTTTSLGMIIEKGEKSPTFWERLRKT